MASITRRKTLKGLRYKAEILIKEKGEIIHRESKTFSKKASAVDWAAERERELRGAGGVDRVLAERVTVGDVVQRYIDSFTPDDGFGRSKAHDINKLLTCPMSKKSVMRLTVKDLIEHARYRKDMGAGPSTINNDYVWLSGIFKTVRASDGIPIDLSLIPDAKALLRQHKMIARSRRRDRRPTRAELWALSRYFWRKQYRSCMTVPMLHLMWFQIYSARRDAETCRLRWDDNNAERRTGMVRDAKHPTAKKGNHKRFKYTAGAWKIVERQSRGGELIFPYNAKTVSTYFAKACKVLGIDDLRLHDLRHEGTSRLFEQGYPIEQVALHTLHEDWATLKRYTHLRPEDID
jgi:integrase